MNVLKISAIIIAKNEEINIARCIDSLHDAVDEIVVVVDSTSTDRTLEIVKSKNVTCLVSDWQGYSKAKQLAVSKTTHDWILWIDADEALSPELNKELRGFKSKLPQFNAYSIPRKANFLGRWIKYSGWYPGYVTRLFNKNRISFNERDVHEGLEITEMTGRLSGDLEHWTDPTIEHYINKFNLYTSLAAKELFDKERAASTSDLILRPAFLFIKMFIIRRGFLDGFHGFILAVFSSAYVFTKYAKLMEMHQDLTK